jgi:hypothetical protein
MPEWTNGADSKSVVLLRRDRGFESLFLRNKNKCPRRGIFNFEPVPNLFEQWEEIKNDKDASPTIVFIAGFPFWDHDRRE